MKKDLKKLSNHSHRKAFTIIEISVVLVIIGILFMQTLSSTKITNNIKNRITKDRMTAIYKTMGSFLADKKRLPCPASILLDKKHVDYGKEVRDINTFMCLGSGIYNPTGSPSSINISFGMVPIQDLGLPSEFAEDGFGNKISFFIDKRFAMNYIEQPDNNLSVPSFGTANYKGIMTIKNRTNVGAITINNDAILVLLSHGENGYGSFKTTGIQNSIGNLLEEIENSLSSFASGSPIFDKIFYANFDGSDQFDDIVFFKTRNDFVNDFKLMSLIPCKGSDIVDSDFDQYSVYYGETLTAYSSCTLGFESIFKKKKCDSYGRIVDLIPSCPSTSTLTCTVGGSNGMKSKTVSYNSSGSDGECEANFSGYYTWSCSANGEIFTSNNCVAYCNFAASLGMDSRVEAPGTYGNGSCTTGYIGYYEWECDEFGNPLRNNYCNPQ